MSHGGISLLSESTSTVKFVHTINFLDCFGSFWSCVHVPILFGSHKGNTYLHCILTFVLARKVLLQGLSEWSFSKQCVCAADVFCRQMGEPTERNVPRPTFEQVKGTLYKTTIVSVPTQPFGEKVKIAVRSLAVLFCCVPENFLRGTTSKSACVTLRTASLGQEQPTQTYSWFTLRWVQRACPPTHTKNEPVSCWVEVLFKSLSDTLENPCCV